MVDPTTVDAATLRLWSDCGDAWTVPDAVAGYPLLAWLTGPGGVLATIDGLCRDSDAGPGWSVLLDVDRCPTYALPWLGQMVGVRVDPDGSDAAQRAQIRAEQGFTRGTPGALVAAARPFLRGTQTVQVTERDTGPYHLTVTVWAGELLGLTYAELSAQYPTYTALTGAFATYDDYAASTSQLSAALLAAKPAGLLLTLSVQAGTPGG